ncbi:MAG: Unknown protein [uncultured Sulfurovum sp.]|uniref:Uncharacterized protein n=1 Tax=uncultured Sulfurovum sp. TaxID=269237 RepID=A0A6S6TXY5_9BACT|nr:MAG: Unknown protein [uncultured Sulfurovum sp.]
MKKIFEKVAIGAVIFLMIAIVVLIIQYNMIGSDSSENLTNHTIESKKVMSKEETTNSYLNSIEGYEEVDVKEDNQKKETPSNQVSVKPELSKSKIDQVIDNQVNEKNRDINLAIDAALNEI